MNILFITEHFYPDNNANANILYEIAKQFEKQGNKIVVVRTHKEEVAMTNIFFHSNLKIYQVNYSGLGYKETLLNTIQEKDLLNFVKVLSEGIYSKFVKLLNEAYLPTFEKIAKSISNIVETEQIDVVISVCAPFYMNYVGYLVKKNNKVKWIMYMLDPYFNHYLGFEYLTKRIKNEMRMLKYVDAAVVTDLIFESYETNKLKTYINKVNKLSFPNIKYIEINKELKDIEFEDSNINCVFVGYLYPDIRSPKFLFDILKESINSKIKLYIVGGVYGEFQDGFLEYYQKELDGKLIFCGKVESNVAYNAILNADILINIGNTIPNQMPSKIFDYISSGKPIVNFCKLDNCPTLKYTKLYPMCLDIIEGDTLTDEIVKRFEEFCIKNKGKQIVFSEIEEIYYDCTSEVVASEFMRIIDKVVEVK
jgi:hypothetical protein